MKLVSLIANNDKNIYLHDLLNIKGSIRQIIIISGYIDLDVVEELIDYLEDNHDGRVYPVLKIFTDSSSSCFYSNKNIEEKYKELSKRILKFCSSDSGIFLVRVGKLFHSKCFIIESNNYRKFIIGSLNLTKKGLNENEELILLGTTDIAKKTKILQLTNWIIDDYLQSLEKRSIKVSQNTETRISPLFLRHILLQGNIYYELKENDPFRFKLRLPKELTDVQAQEIHPLLDGSIKDSISIIALITRRQVQGGLGKKLPEKLGSKLSWKKYCIETCYGFWSPSFFINKISEVIEERKKLRKPYYQKVKTIIVEERNNIFEKFKVFIEDLNNYICKNYSDIEWEYYQDKKIHKAWDKWYRNLEKKLNNTEYYDRLVSGITSASVPDVWNDPLSSREFEESFLESIIYYWSKEYSKETKNKIAQVISKNLNLSDDDKKNMDIEKLKKLIEEWLQKYEGQEIFNDED